MTRPALDAADRFLESHFRLNPVDATFAGVHSYDDRLPDWSPGGLEEALSEQRSLRSSMAASGTGGAFPANTPADIDRALTDSSLEIRIAELSGSHFQRGNPSLWAGEAIFGVIGLMTREFAPLDRRARAAAARMDAIAAFLARARESITDAPAAWITRALRECEGAEALFGAGVDKWLAGETSPRALAACRAARRARQAFAGFSAWLRGLRVAPETRYACGREMLELLIKRGHWCPRSAADLLAEARESFDEAHSRLTTMARAIAPGGWPEVQERLSDRHPSARGYLDAYRRCWDQCRDLAEARDLVSWPADDAWPIRFVPIPVATRAAAPYLYYLFYRSPAPLDPVRVHDAVTPPLESSLSVDERERFLRANNDSVIKLNHVVHHGAIGHHLQNYHATRAASRIGRVAAVDAACRISLFCGGSLAEGWACYATDLMDEVGFFTADERVAQQHTRVRMLARALVDLQLHTGAMSLDAAAAFYVERLGLTQTTARAEAVKNSMFPGTALMYWLGTQGLHDLRAVRAPASLRAFHDEVLSYGAIPVPMIARLMSRERGA